MQLKDKVIAITGAGQGIGRAIAEMFAAGGAHIALIDLKAEALAEAQAACEKLGVPARSYTANVADEAAVETCANQAQRYGQVRVTNVQQVRNDTLRVNGAVAVNGGWQQRGFYCDFRADGRITGFDIQ